MSWQNTVETTVTGLGYELVECERSAGGMLRVFLDRLPGKSYPSGPGEFITVDDCELVTRQLKLVLEVEGLDYSRLEVSSPGLDRPLHRDADYRRFAGCEIDITLKMMFAGRKKYRGLLRLADEAYELVFKDGVEDKVLGFALDEVREARLVPVVDFKGRKPAGKPVPAAPATPGALGERPVISGDHQE
jgi:ribosome maturation factor RimP